MRFLLSRELMMGISSIIMKTIKYPLYATTFSKEETNHLVKLIHDPVLPRCKLYRKLLLILRYRPKDSMGLGLHKSFTTQGIEKVILWIKEKGLDSLIGSLL